jgi:hypothetical protein
MSQNFNSGSRPRVACEIAADRVIAGRIAEKGGKVEMCASHELPPGCVVPDLMEVNLRERKSSTALAVDRATSSRSYRTPLSAWCCWTLRRFRRSVRKPKAWSAFG